MAEKVRGKVLGALKVNYRELDPLGSPEAGQWFCAQRLSTMVKTGLDTYRLCNSGQIVSLF